MKSEQNPIHASTDDGIYASRGSNIASIRLVGFDRPFLTAIALVASLFALGFCFFTEAQETKRVYFTQRCEAFIEQAAFDHKPIPYTICGTREN